MANEITYDIQEVFGSLSDSSWATQLCKISWNGGPAKFDLRPWNEDMTKCGRGVTMTEAELDKLFRLIGDALGYEISDGEEDDEEGFEEEE